MTTKPISKTSETTSAMSTRPENIIWIPVQTTTMIISPT